jgi:LmbE family N-acetylglucosaminyl deacetylase
MKPTFPSETKLAPLLVVGAHPDDIEFGCGGVVVKETRAGRPAHFVICSRGEAGSFGTPIERSAEAERGAAILGASLEFLQFDGDSHLSIDPAHAITLARIVRARRPSVVLAPTVVQNQHPDHWRLGTLARDAVRLARYGGIAELLDAPPHAIEQLLFYALTPDAEPRDTLPLLVDVSAAEVVTAWTAAMEAHASQMRVRRYVDLCLMRARVNGLRAGVEHAIALFPNDPILVDSLAQLTCGARGF